MELVLSELKVIWWAELKDNCNCGKTGFWALHRHKKTGVCLRLLLVRMYSRVNPLLALCFSLFIYQGCHSDERGLPWRTIISREPVWMWHVLFSQALFRCWFTCICCTLPPPPPHLQQRQWWQTFKGSMYLTPTTACQILLDGLDWIDADLKSNSMEKITTSVKSLNGNLPFVFLDFPMPSSHLSFVYSVFSLPLSLKQCSFSQPAHPSSLPVGVPTLERDPITG